MTSNEELMSSVSKRATEAERSRIITHLEQRLDSHAPYHNTPICLPCNTLRQVIGFINAASISE